MKALGEAKITKYNPLNEKFDPETASALFEMPKADGKEAGVVRLCAHILVCRHTCVPTSS